MSKIGIFYGSSTGNTETIAKYIQKELAGKSADLFDISGVNVEEILKYDFLIFGASTWGEGELQDDWEDFLPKLSKLDLAGKKAALFGLGDQEGYPDTFMNALKEIYDALLETGIKIVGETADENYEYEASSAVVDGKFIGLALDEDNQSSLTNARVASWLTSLSIFL